MANKRNVVAEELRSLAQDLKERLAALTTDPKEHAKKQRRWRILYGLSTAVFTLAARRLAARAWAILTGEQPPTARTAGPQATKAPAASSEPGPSPEATASDAPSAERVEDLASRPEATRAPATGESREL
jgi:hypothetical protein